MKTAIVNKQTMSVATVYDGAPDQGKFGGEWGRPEACQHILIEDLDVDCLEVILVEGEIALQEDAAKATAKVQATRNAKLAKLRDARDEKMKEVDVMVNELALGERDDQEAVKAYRNALKDSTAPYKYANDPERAKAAIDGVDLEEFEWPEAPEAE